MMKDKNRKTAKNGKGDAPRNNFSKEYRSRYEAINWKPKKEQKPKQNTHNP